jgi:hypothetical protein
MTVNAFPALIPSSRTFLPGEYPNTAFRSWNGTENRVRHSNVMLASRLVVSFLYLPESQMLQIFQHYQDALGGFLAFAIPADLLEGVSNAADYTLTNYLWRYAEPPLVEDLPCSTTGNSRHSVQITLESVQPEPVFVLGLAA